MRKKKCSWCTACEKATKGETCADQMTGSFQAHKDDVAILEPSACDAFRVCEETVLRCMCTVCGCPVYTVDFLEFVPGSRNHHHFSDDVGCHELQLVCHCEVGRCRHVSILHFPASFLIHRQNLVAVEEVSGAHQHSNDEPNVWRSARVAEKSCRSRAMRS